MTSPDALSDVLRQVQLTGAVFVRAELSAPWAVVSPPSRELAEVLMPQAEHLIEFHVVVEGHCWIGVAGEAPVALGPGDLVMVPRGDAHRMGSDLAAPALPMSAQDLQHSDGTVTALNYGGGGDVTRLVCGYLAIDRRLCAALLDALPRVLRVAAGSSELSVWLASVLRLRHDGERGPGADAVLAKLAELMFVDAVRRYARSLPPQQVGWFAALHDRHVGRALALLHAQPARAWTMPLLAREVGASRSALAGRFTALIGQAPMRYLARWRLTLAAQALRSSARPAAAVAWEVGYESEAAFSRAFRRAFGTPPGLWRETRVS